MKKIIRLTENDLMKLVKRVIKEQQNQILFTKTCTKTLVKSVYVLPNSTLNLNFPTGSDMSFSSSKGEKFVQKYVIDKVTSKPSRTSEENKFEEVNLTFRFVYDFPTTEQSCILNIDNINKTGGFVSDSDPNLRSSQNNNKTLTFTNFKTESMQCLVDIIVPENVKIVSNLQSELFTN
jgi:hypothetical protein